MGGQRWGDCRVGDGSLRIGCIRYHRRNVFAHEIDQIPRLRLCVNACLGRYGPWSVLIVVHQSPPKKPTHVSVGRKGEKITYDKGFVALFYTSISNTSAVSSIIIRADTHRCKLHDTPAARFFQM